MHSAACYVHVSDTSCKMGDQWLTRSLEVTFHRNGTWDLALRTNDRVHHLWRGAMGPWRQAQRRGAERRREQRVRWRRRVEYLEELVAQREDEIEAARRVVEELLRGVQALRRADAERVARREARQRR